MNKIFFLLLFLLAYNGIAFSCHQWVVFEGGLVKGHKGDRYFDKAYSRTSFIGIFSQVSLDPWIYSTHVTTDTTSTTTDCNARTAEIFIHQEFNKIAEDISKGEGSHLEALASHTGCNQEKFQEWSTLLKINYENLFSNNEPKLFIAYYNNLMKNRSEFLTCSITG